MQQEQGKSVGNQFRKLCLTDRHTVRKDVIELLHMGVGRKAIQKHKMISQFFCYQGIVTTGYRSVKMNPETIAGVVCKVFMGAIAVEEDKAICLCGNSLIPYAKIHGAGLDV